MLAQTCKDYVTYTMLTLRYVSANLSGRRFGKGFYVSLSTITKNYVCAGGGQRRLEQVTRSTGGGKSLWTMPYKTRFAINGPFLLH